MNPEYKTLPRALQALVQAFLRGSPEHPILLRRKQNPMVYMLIDHDAYAVAPNSAEFKPWEIAIRLYSTDIARLAGILQIDLFEEESNASTS